MSFWIVHVSPGHRGITTQDISQIPGLSLSASPGENIIDSLSRLRLFPNMFTWFARKRHVVTLRGSS